MPNLNANIHGEPMAWMQKDEVGQEWLSTHVWKCPTTPMEYDNMVPLYLHPPMREPPVLHERTPEDDGWICCCGDHLLDDTFPGREEVDETPEEYTARYEAWCQEHIRIQVVCPECECHVRGALAGTHVRWEVCPWCEIDMKRPSEMSLQEVLRWWWKGAPLP